MVFPQMIQSVFTNEIMQQIADALQSTYTVFPRATVSFQKHAARSKVYRFPKIVHWMISNALKCEFERFYMVPMHLSIL